MEDVVFDSSLLEIKFMDVEKRQQAIEWVTKDIATKREKVWGKLDAFLTNFDALANNYTKNILKLKAKLLALENDKQARLLKEASAPFLTRVGGNAHNKNYEALHNWFESQISKLTEDGARLWEHLESLQASRDVNMLDYGPHGRNSRHNPIHVGQTNSKSLEILKAWIDNGGVVYSTHILGSL
jgi:hypothetical protein